MHRQIAVLAAAGALAAPAAAQAHVTLQPKTAQAGSFTVLDVRVPNERNQTSTVKVDVQFPAGFASVSYQPIPGWKVKVITTKLATPVQTDDGPITEAVSRMIWTGSRSAGGKIAPGQFMDFPISVQVPGKAGDVLTFKALQTYSNGEIVRWIGAADADQPAPTIDVTAGPLPAATNAAAPAATRTVVEKQSANDTLAIIALVVGLLGLAAGGGGLLVARRTQGGQRTSHGA
jgi:uncharacterized protein